MPHSIKKAVIPVAGWGTRGLPFTKEVPKEMIPILDIPAIHFVVEEAIHSGIEQIIFVTARGKSALEDYFDDSPYLIEILRKKGKHEQADFLQKIGKMCEIISVRQKEPKGLGHAILAAKNVVGNEPFGVCLADEIFPSWDPRNKSLPPLKQLTEISKSTGLSSIGVMEIDPKDSSSYGMIRMETPKFRGIYEKVLGTVEKPTPEKSPSNYAVVGRYVFQPEIMAALSEVKPGFGGEIQLTDAMDSLCSNKGLLAVDLKNERYDVGNLFQFLKAQIDFALKKPELSDKLKSYLSDRK